MPTTLREVMSHDPHTLPASATVREAIERLEAGPVRHLPVMDGKRVVGIVSERDVRPWRQALWDLEAGEATVAAVAALQQPVRKVMRTDVLFLRSERPVADAIDVMLDFRIGAVPVVDDGRLVGIVSYVDLLEYLRLLLTEGAPA